MCTGLLRTLCPLAYLHGGWWPLYKCMCRRRWCRCIEVNSCHWTTRKGSPRPVPPSMTCRYRRRERRGTGEGGEGLIPPCRTICLLWEIFPIVEGVHWYVLHSSYTVCVQCHGPGDHVGSIGLTAILGASLLYSHCRLSRSRK
jgi:hypothetical protein